MSIFPKEKLQVLDRTKALYGPRTRAYRETNYLKEKLQVLDKTEALYGPRTRACGETNYLKEKGINSHTPLKLLTTGQKTPLTFLLANLLLKLFTTAKLIL